MNETLLKDFFERDLNDAEEAALMDQVAADPAAAQRLADMAAGFYASTGLPQPAAPASGLPWITVAAVAAGSSLATWAFWPAPAALAPPAQPQPAVERPMPQAPPKRPLSRAAVPGIEGDTLSVEIRLPAPRELRVDVYSPQGKPVRRLAQGRFQAGVQSFTWDGLDESMEPVEPGAYKVLVDYGSGTMQKILVIKGEPE